MKVLFAPIGIISGFVAGLLAKRAFTALWGRVSDFEAPEPDQQQAPLTRLAAALAIQGAVFQLVRGLVDRGTRAGFFRLTGTWPGERRPDPA